MEQIFIEEKNVKENSVKEVNEHEVLDVAEVGKIHKSPKRMKILSIEEVSEGIENLQFKNEIVKKYAKMIKKGVSAKKKNDDFVKYIYSGNIYVDKSLYIEHILKEDNNLIITCPRRWGKSLNLSMLKAFLQPDGYDINHYIDGKYEYDFSKENKHSVLFKGGEITTDSSKKKTLNELNIAKDKEFYKLYQGQFPVIYLNLKTSEKKEFEKEIKKEDEYNFEDFEDKLRLAISHSYEEHTYLTSWLETNKTNLYGNVRINKFRAYLNQKKTFIDYDKKELKAQLYESMIFLSNMLFEYYGKEVFLIVDEFDKPVNEFLSKGYFFNQLKIANTLSQIVFDIICECSKGTTSTKQIILTGILNSEILKESSPMNNFEKEGIMTESLAGFFGFDSNEVKWVLDQAFTFNNDYNYKDLLYDKLKEWYNGQIISENYSVFTPSSVMSYIRKLIEYSEKPANQIPKFDMFWGSTATTDILNSFAKIAFQKNFNNIIEKLVNISYKKNVRFNYNTNIALSDIINRFDFSDSDFEELIFHYLLRSGYITKTYDLPDQYKLPAREIESIYLESVVKLWKKDLYLNKDCFLNIVYEIDFSTYDKKKVDEEMNNALVHVTKKYSTLKEEVFRIILHQAIEGSKIKSKCIDVEFKSGSGRVDLIYYYQSVVNLYELKFVEGTPDKKLNDAIEQIYEKNYMKDVLKLLKKEKYKELNVNTIKLIPVVLYRDTNNTNWKYETGNIYEHNIDEAEKIVKKIEDEEDPDTKELLVKHLIAKNKIDSFVASENYGDSDIKISLQELITEIKNSKYNLKYKIIGKLEDDNKQYFTKNEALSALNAKDKNAKGRILIKNIYKNYRANQNQKKNVLNDEHIKEKFDYLTDDLDFSLKLRMKEEQISDSIIRLNTHKSYEYFNISDNISDLLLKVKEKLLPENTVIVPYAKEEHFIGLVFKTTEEGTLTLNYLDSNNMKIEEDLKKELIKRSVKIYIIQTKKQLYDYNCREETIENLIAYLRGENLLNRKISQDKAIEIYNDLIEQSLVEDLKLKEIIRKKEVKAHKKIPRKMSTEEEYEVKDKTYKLKKKKRREDCLNS